LCLRAFGFNREHKGAKTQKRRFYSPDSSFATITRPSYAPQEGQIEWDIRFALQREQVAKDFGFFAWWERLLFFLAFEVRLRGTGMTFNSLKLFIAVQTTTIFTNL
jgi:hypothetical protein